MAHKPHVIVLGNEKGGTGKSTTAMHLITYLLRLGFQVGTMDVDARQGTLTRYFANRKSYVEKRGIALPLSEHRAILKSRAPTVAEAEAEDRAHFDAVMGEFAAMDFVVIDTPGSEACLSSLAHSAADTIITPMNDSFIDLDLLVHLDPDNPKNMRPSIYAASVWEYKKARAIADGGVVDWIVLRNRLSNIRARNKEEMSAALGELSKRIGFRFVPGFGERVIFRELFLSGLTLLDLKDVGESLTLSHVAARQELRALMAALNLPQLTQKLQEAA